MESARDSERGSHSQRRRGRHGVQASHAGIFFVSKFLLSVVRVKGWVTIAGSGGPHAAVLPLSDRDMQISVGGCFENNLNIFIYTMRPFVAGHSAVDTVALGRVASRHSTSSNHTLANTLRQIPHHFLSCPCLAKKLEDKP